MTLHELNGAGIDTLREQLLKCCGSEEWAERLIHRRPFHSFESLSAASDDIWWSLGENEWLNAFAKHPRIGEKTAQGWSSDEQRGMAAAELFVAEKMVQLNREYQSKFGWIFIVCATGKKGEEMLAILEKRMKNDPNEELRVAASEQAQITKLRLQKLLAS